MFRCSHFLKVCNFGLFRMNTSAPANMGPKTFCLRPCIVHLSPNMVYLLPNIVHLRPNMPIAQHGLSIQVPIGCWSVSNVNRLLSKIIGSRFCFPLPPPSRFRDLAFFVFYYKTYHVPIMFDVKNDITRSSFKLCLKNIGLFS